MDASVLAEASVRVRTWPGCDAPPQLSEVHHAVHHWADGGETATDNGALLCWYHHDHVDSRDIRMTRTAGRWRFHHPDGTPIPEHPPPQPSR